MLSDFHNFNFENIQLFALETTGLNRPSNYVTHFNSCPRYIDIIDRHADVVKTHLFGHIHGDEFRTWPSEVSSFSWVGLTVKGILSLQHFFYQLGAFFCKLFLTRPQNILMFSFLSDRNMNL